MKECETNIGNIPYRKVEPDSSKCFDDYLISIDYKIADEELFGKYAVLDVETNGLSSVNDDLLSVSIYDPTMGKCYNRFLPLDLQPMVLTGWINKIDENDLDGCPHLTQSEVDELIQFFELDKKTLLFYSGNDFDPKFIQKYCERHNLVGFENIHYKNIKPMISKAGFDCIGKLTKDNICELLDISGVEEKHSSLNDCILEWKLFEKIRKLRLVFIGRDLYNFNENYIVPISKLNEQPKLAEYANITVPDFIGKAECIFQFDLPKQVSQKIMKFETNITGIALEEGMNAFLRVEKQNSLEFCIKNKACLGYICSLDSNYEDIFVKAGEDGNLEALDPKDDKLIHDVNSVTNVFIKQSKPVFEFIGKEIFKGGKIKSQEISLSDDGKVFALCDLSDKNSILEIKTCRNIFEASGFIKNSIARQLYYESKGRKIYLLWVDITGKTNKSAENVSIRIYHVTLQNVESNSVTSMQNRGLLSIEIKVLIEIQKNPSIKNVEIAKKANIAESKVSKAIKNLKNMGYIAKENESDRTSPWIVLRKYEKAKKKT